jgi:hypothetical protein
MKTRLALRKTGEFSGIRDCAGKIYGVDGFKVGVSLGCWSIVTPLESVALVEDRNVLTKNSQYNSFSVRNRNTLG